MGVRPTFALSPTVLRVERFASESTRLSPAKAGCASLLAVTVGGETATAWIPTDVRQPSIQSKTVVAAIIAVLSRTALPDVMEHVDWTHATQDLATATGTSPTVVR